MSQITFFLWLGKQNNLNQVNPKIIIYLHKHRLAVIGAFFMLGENPGIFYAHF